MAAGIILVREAGGFVTDLDGGENIMAKSQIAAGNETMHQRAPSAPARGRQGTGAAAAVRKARGSAPRAPSPCRKGCGSHRPGRGVREIVHFSPTALPMSSVPYCARYRALTIKADGEQPRPSQAVFAPHLSGPDAGVSDPVRADRLCPAASDPQRLHGQSRGSTG